MDRLWHFLRHIHGQIILRNAWISQPQQIRDQHIMDDLLAYNFPTNQLIQINSVRLYLKVNLLSEIVDHTGMQILPDALKPTQPLDNVTYTSTNHSTLDWPRQPKPGPTAWKKWKEMLLWMYTKPNSNTLTTTLGPWHASYSQDYEWAWQIHKPTQTLYHHHRHVWYKYWTPRHHLNTWVYSSHHTPRASIPTNTQPVTPTLSNKSITITLPITQIQVPDLAAPQQA